MADQNIGPLALTPEQIAQEQIAAAQAQAVDPNQVQQTGTYTPEVQYGGYAAKAAGMPGYENAGNMPDWLKGGQLANSMGVQAGNYPVVGAPVQQAGSPVNATSEQLNSAMGAATAPIPTTPVDESQFESRTKTAPVKNQAASASPYSSAADAIGQSHDIAMRANTAYADASVIKAQDVATELAAQNKVIEKQEQERVAKYAEHEAQVNAQVADLQATGNEMKNFKFNDFWTDKSTGQKVMAGIALALGGIGGAFTGRGDNKAMEIINQAIDRDINLQKMNFQKLGAQADNTKSVLGAMHQKFGNMMQAEAAARIYAITASQNRLTSIVSRFESKEMQARMATANADLQVKKQLAEAEFRKAGMLQAQMGDLSNLDLKNPTPAQLDLLESRSKGYRDRHVAGYGEASNKEAAQEFQKFRAEVEPAMNLASDVFKASKALTFKDKLSPEKRAQFETQLTLLAGKLRLPVTGPGALTDDEYKRLRTTLGDPKQIFRLTTNAAELKKLQTVINWLSGDLGTRAEMAGLQRPRGIQDVNFDSSFGGKK